MKDRGEMPQALCSEFTTMFTPKLCFLEANAQPMTQGSGDAKASSILQKQELL